MGVSLSKILSGFFCCFIPKKSVRHAVREYFSRREEWKAATRSNTINIAKGQERYVRLHVDGHDNHIVIKRMASGSRGILNIRLAGNRCTIAIDESLHIGTSLDITIGQRHPNFGSVSDVAVRIGSRCSFEQASILTFNSHSSISIGSDCMISFGVDIYNTDAHPVLDRDTGRIINRVRELSIGDHCWLGQDATILKNVRLGKDCIVAWGAIVSSGISREAVPEACILAGNPATVVKRGISWSSDGSGDYVRNAP